MTQAHRPGKVNLKKKLKKGKHNQSLINEHEIKRKTSTSLDKGMKLFDLANCVWSLTKINDFQCAEEFVLEVQVLRRCFAAVVLDEGKASRPKNVVVGALDWPVEV